jgi:REP element-mobilizing transposase RayT
MSRPKRVCAAGLTYHVFSRCINKEDLLKKSFVKELLIIVIKETQERYKFKLNAFEILDNHIHLVVQTENEQDTISKIMQRLKSVFAKRYNKLMDRCGPFWNDRFGSKIIEQAKSAISYFLQLILYLGYNSVRKGYVSDPRDYKYGSFKKYIHKNSKCKLDITPHDYFLMLGNNFRSSANMLLECEEKYRGLLGLV